MKLLTIPLLIAVVAISGCTSTGQATTPPTPIPMPTFSVQDAGSSSIDLLAGYSINLKFNVVNNGDGTATDTRANIEFVDNTGKVAAQDTYVLGTMNPGEARLIEKRYNLWRGRYTVNIRVASTEGASYSYSGNIG